MSEPPRRRVTVDPREVSSHAMKPTKCRCFGGYCIRALCHEQAWEEAPDGTFRRTSPSARVREDD